MKAAPLFGRLAALAAIGAACALPIEARAAMRGCEKPLAGDVAEDRNEMLAKKRTLESWVARAGQHGQEFTNWRIAWDRQIDCQRTDSGFYRCKAVGRPCTIRQVPPDEFTPLKRGVPG